MLERMPAAKACMTLALHESGEVHPTAGGKRQKQEIINPRQHGQIRAAGLGPDDLNTRTSHGENKARRRVTQGNMTCGGVLLMRG